MEEILYVVSNVVRIGIWGLDLAMMARMIMSWFPMEPNVFTELVFNLTEPLIYPVRALFRRLNWFTDSPLDIPFLVTSICLVLLGSAITFIL